MPLLVYKISDYDHTAEREQYRSLCKQLRDYYGNRDEICIFVANYNIYDCELDGILIKQDAIMSVEFKNYGGNIIAVDNGQWTTEDGTIIKGGSRKSVYQQAKLNHIAIKNGFKDGMFLDIKILREVAALVVFHQPIVLDNQLPLKTQSWLHVCDEDTFMEKVQDITNSKMDLSEEDMLRLVERMALYEEDLDEEYSNKEILEGFDEEEELNDSIECDIKIDDKNSEDLLQPQDMISKGSLSSRILDDELQDLYHFVEQILQQILKQSDSIIHIYDSQDCSVIFSSNGDIFTKQYIITVEHKGISTYSSKIGRFINHNVKSINPNFIYFEAGDDISVIGGVKENVELKQEIQLENDLRDIKFRKSKTILPHWLDRKIFNDLEAIYRPEHERYEYNLDLNEDELKVYLGTYFPRSYAEMFCIVDNLFQNSRYNQVIKDCKEINILDCGCGTGGEIIGLIIVIGKYHPQCKINITAIDGNEGALKILRDVISVVPTYVCQQICLKTITKTIVDNRDINSLVNGIDSEYQFVLCDKMVCELISKKIFGADGYAILADLLIPHIADNGILTILDITTKDENTGYFYPQLMNRSLNDYVLTHNTIETLIPLSCACRTNCKELCFMQQCFYVSHSHKSEDESRVCYRILCKKIFKDVIMENVVVDECSHIIHPMRYQQNEESSICRRTDNRKKLIDTFNINQ